ncbi:DUF1289 domain-containing protein [Brucella pituitosa]|nr:DUF1289 domain-containing protein [Brucella pituitosa]
MTNRSPCAAICQYGPRNKLCLGCGGFGARIGNFTHFGL